MEILIYKHDQVIIQPSEKLDYEVWSPSLRHLYHQRLPKKYIIWTLFYYLGVFKNKNYKVFSLFVNNKRAVSFCMVPKYFKWKFMKDDDVQFVYVLTEEEFRGKGFGRRFMSVVLSELDVKGDIWWVTNSANIASQKLAERLGFKIKDKGIKLNFFFGMINCLNLKNENEN